MLWARQEETSSERPYTSSREIELSLVDSLSVLSDSWIFQLGPISVVSVHLWVFFPLPKVDSVQRAKTRMDNAAIVPDRELRA